MRIERVIKEKTWKRGVRKGEVYRERLARKRKKGNPTKQLFQHMKKEKKAEEEKSPNNMVVMTGVEVRIIGCNKVEFMAPKGSETRTSLTSFFYLAQYLKLNCTVLILYNVESTCKILCHRL